MLIRMNAAQAGAKTNKLERIGYAMLDEIGVLYEKQYLIGGKFCVDAFLPDYGLIIQFDGDYWHANPKMFPEPSAQQRNRIRLDISQDNYMYACGYAVHRVWESDVKRDVDKCLAIMLESIERQISDDFSC